jgi:CheY-like chemotaxis protein
MLPGNINGLDVYKHIRERDQDIPIMFISGNIEFLESMKKLKEKDLNLEHVSKPVDNLDYVNKINELIEKSNT